MNLCFLQEDALLKYKSPSQRIRVMSECWFGGQMYCPACASKEIRAFPNNKKVADFYCPKCDEQFQLKCQSKSLGGRITDGAYDTLITAMNLKKLPNFFFLHYAPTNYYAQNLTLVPNFFFSNSIIEKRKPLSENARRHGWVGCNILYKNIADEGKIKIIENGEILNPAKVRRSWKKTSFLKNVRIESRGWLNDIMYCIHEIGKPDFELEEIYSFEEYLSGLHPQNKYIKAKIRQQLQVLRDNNFLKFVDNKGKYHLG